MRFGFAESVVGHEEIRLVEAGGAGMLGQARRLLRNDDGAETTEAAMVLVLIGIAAMAGITLAGQATNNLWNALATSIGGIFVP